MNFVEITKEIHLNIYERIYYWDTSMEKEKTTFWRVNVSGKKFIPLLIYSSNGSVKAICKRYKFLIKTWKRNELTLTQH